MVSDWLAAVFSGPDLSGALVIAGKTTVVYLFLVIGLQLVGRRELGQMTIYDLVLIIVLANSVQNAMVGNDNTLFGGLIAAVTLLLLNRIATTLIVRYPWLERRVVGEPAILAKDGRLFEERMKREGVTRELLMAALREHGLTRLEDAQMIVLEVDGTISVVPRDSTVHRTKHHFRALRIN